MHFFRRKQVCLDRALTCFFLNQDEGNEDRACIRTFKGHSKGVYPLIFIPSEDSGFSTEGLAINPGDLLITGSADHTARSWSFDTGGCLKVNNFIWEIGDIYKWRNKS